VVELGSCSQGYNHAQAASGLALSSHFASVAARDLVCLTLVPLGFGAFAAVPQVNYHQGHFSLSPGNTYMQMPLPEAVAWGVDSDSPHSRLGSPYSQAGPLGVLIWPILCLIRLSATEHQLQTGLPGGAGEVWGGAAPADEPRLYSSLFLRSLLGLLVSPSPQRPRRLRPDTALGHSLPWVSGTHLRSESLVL
jgi:hypothetical protein